MRKRHVFLSLALAAVLAAIALWLYTDQRRPPQLVRMLPEASSVLYADIAPIRTATNFDQHWEFERDAGLDAFVRETGIQPARDLDEIALAIQGGESDRRYSELMRGRFDAARLTAWLKAHADSTESYRGKDIFTVVHERRPVRVAVLAGDLVAASNTDDPLNIRAMLDHHVRTSAGPAVVSMNYVEIPAASPVWWMAHLDRDTAPQVPMGKGNAVGISLPAGTTLVGSIRYLGNVQCNLIALAPSEADANTIAERARVFAHVAQTVVGGLKSGASADDWSRLADSLSIDQQNSTVRMKAEIPTSLLDALAHSTDAPAQH